MLIRRKARAGIDLSGLGFDGPDKLRPCADFSGVGECGWRWRDVLFAPADISAAA